MAREHIVVDGSNLATEGRSAPSLAQLEEAVAELRRERPEAEVTVVVDATFSHRIDPSELARFEEAALKGEYVHPPAGAIGRGDAFLLRIAEKIDATVLSNDSFQEFHGEHPWLFDRGRLFGATPVPGIGWIFSPRTPVRGPKSRRAVKDQKGDDKAKRKVSKAIEAATKEAVAPPAAVRNEPADGSRRRQRPALTAAAVNDPLAFISFIADHPLGTEVTGEVESYTSHGAVVTVEGTQCYLPLANMAVPAPRSAREVVKKTERREFVVVALDPQRRGVELAIPGVAAVSGRPSEETIAAELRLAKKKATPNRPAAKKAARQRADEPETAAPGAAVAAGEAAPKRARARRGPTPPGSPAPAAPSEEAPEPASKRAASGAKRAVKSRAAAPARQRAATKPPATKPAARKQPAKRASAARKMAESATSAQAGVEQAPARRQEAAKRATAAERPPARKAAGGKEAVGKEAVGKEPAPRRSPRRSAS